MVVQDFGEAALRERDLERLARFRLLDDTFMRVVFRGNLPLAQRVLRTITGIGTLVLTGGETQRDLRRATGSRSPALDAFGTDASGTQYDLEVQSGSDLEPRRFRYYGSAMDVDALPAGRPYAELPERWLVVVLERDPAGSAQALRHYRTCAPGGVVLEDGAHLLYANAAYRGDDALGSLMSDFCQADPRLIRDPMLRERVQYLKKSEEGVREMCRISDEIRDEGIEIGRRQGLEQGLEQGLKQGLLNSLRSLMETAHWSAQQAMDALKVPEDQRARYLAMI